MEEKTFSLILKSMLQATKVFVSGGPSAILNDSEGRMAGLQRWFICCEDIPGVSLVFIPSVLSDGQAQDWQPTFSRSALLSMRVTHP